MPAAARVAAAESAAAEVATAAGWQATVHGCRPLSRWLHHCASK